MILTGKAKKDFNIWRFEVLKDSRDYIPMHNDRVVNSLIIDWLDTLGIYVEVGVYPEENGDINFSYTLFGNSSSENFEYWESRQEATKAAIQQANTIYNEKNN